MRFRLHIRMPWPTVLLALIALLAGCSGPSQKSVADWHDAVIAVRDQSSTTFRTVNGLVRESQLRRAASLANLRESDFQPGLDPRSIAIWNRALDHLAAYSASLSTLLSPELAAGVGESTGQLGARVLASSNSQLLQERPGVAAAIGKLAAALTAAAASRSASEIMRKTDPAIDEVLDQMARMIVDDSEGLETGVLPTVRAAWTLQADQARADFLSQTTPDDKRAAAAHYADLLEGRAEAEEAILGLSRSLKELALAHRRAAAGGPTDTSALIATIREQTAFVKSLLADLKPATP